MIGHALPALTPFILSSASAFFGTAVSRVDVGSWSQAHAGKALVLATNLNAFAQSVTVKVPGLQRGRTEKVLDSGGGSATVDASGAVRISLPVSGSVGYVFTW